MNHSEQLLNKRKIRPTAMRMLICQFLEQQKEAVSLTDLEDAFDEADRTTLFRSLKTFEEKGLVHKIDDGSGVAKYALCEAGCTCDIENDLHLHFHCIQCDTTVCLTEYKLPKIHLPKNYKAQDANLVVKGICNKCG